MVTGVTTQQGEFVNEQNSFELQSSTPICKYNTLFLMITGIFISPFLP